MTTVRPAPEETDGYAALMRCAKLLGQASERQAAADAGLTAIQLEILYALIQSKGGLRMYDLAARLNHSRNGMTYQIGQLEKAGLVKRGHAEGNQRAILARITDKGREVCQEAVRSHVAFIHSVFTEPVGDDMKMLTAALNRVVAELERTR
ncbi:MarR family transcriptional regulator [Bifidobacterium sp. ESL0784]|uniref:MarR family winged helix-turn-helix transcriptional regulator n=1 Tax=Bifidobacterium sp. ESL0784 TaxID=2983231 RepID=UPI0023F89896|nr:MarR family transcriptional regulator [Bifidobacterium sp. ESL0784]MDF7640152.1 MarR family transcriptional regulator [Bifidobacterium sp. ESL0784]